MEILKGITIELRVNLWKKLADVILKIVESGELDPEIMPILGMIAPSLLLKIKGNLEIEVDEYLK